MATGYDPLLDNKPEFARLCHLKLASILPLKLASILPPIALTRARQETFDWVT